jgi:hypothetical protein
MVTDCVEPSENENVNWPSMISMLETVIGGDGVPDCSAYRA